jgi:hypothetical protein
VTYYGIPFSGVMQWPYLDITAFGQNKMLTGFDLVGTGDVIVQVGYDETNMDSVTDPFELTVADSLPGQPYAMPCNAPSYSLILTWAPNQAWSWQAAALYSSVTGQS